jgi:hypothetical protein
LFGNVVSLGSIIVSIRASEEFSEDGIVRFLDALGLDVPAGEDERCDVEEALFRVFDLACAKDEFWMCCKVCYTLWK